MLLSKKLVGRCGLPISNHEKRTHSRLPRGDGTRRRPKSIQSTLPSPASLIGQFFATNLRMTRRRRAELDSRLGASTYDVRIGGGGDHGKADVAWEVASILCCKSDPNADTGEGVKKSEHFADIISGSSLSSRRRRPKRRFPFRRFRRR